MRNFKLYIDECVNNSIRTLLTENSIDRKVNKLIKLNFPSADFNRIRDIRAKILLKIPNARSRGGKWMCRVFQWYIRGQISPYEAVRLNKFLGYLHRNNCDDKKINDGDWSDLPFSYVRNYYREFFNSLEKDSTNYFEYSKVKHINGYTIRRIDSEDEAFDLGGSIYNREWCIIDGLFDSMVGKNLTCYIITKDSTYNNAKPTTIETIISGLKMLERYDIIQEISGLSKNATVCDIDNEDYFDLAPDYKLPPYDTYGLSGFVVLVDKDGSIDEVYSRYNIPNMNDGLFLSDEYMSYLLKTNILSVCPFVDKTNLNTQ